jgi:hypothetical protein
MYPYLPRKHSAGSCPACMKTECDLRRTGRAMALATILSLLPLGHSFGSEDGYDVWRVPSGQPAQMSSKINYDPKLWDTFFESDAWGYPHGGQIPAGGMTPEGEGSARSESTAMCFSNSLGVKHLVESCKAKLVDENTIDFLIYYIGPGFHDVLRVRVRKGMFTCQYGSGYQVPGSLLIWTTKRQELTLDQEVYRKGDVIKGRIDFECVQDAKDPEAMEKAGGWIKDGWIKGYWLRTIKVYGVFKTILK